MANDRDETTVDKTALDARFHALASVAMTRYPDSATAAAQWLLRQVMADDALIHHLADPGIEKLVSDLIDKEAQLFWRKPN
jgi:hypothetical protein